MRFTAPTYMFLTYPPEWRATCSQTGYVSADPTVQWRTAHNGHVSRADLSKGDDSGIFAHSAPFGMAHGVTVTADEDDSRSLALPCAACR